MRSLVLIFSYIRSPFIVVFSALWTAFWATLQMVIYPSGSDWWRRYFISRGWSIGLLAVAGVRLKVFGLENLPSEGSIYVFNHTTLYDIPIAHSALPKFLRFGAKQELFKVPFLASGMRGLKVIPIDRANREKVLASYRKIYPEVKAGDNVILAPEGTRQKEEKIGNFKTGPFIFSLECQCPMVPVVICGGQSVLGKKGFWINIGHMFADVHVKILKPINPQNYSLTNINQMMDDVRVQMTSTLADLQSSRRSSI